MRQQLLHLARCYKSLRGFSSLILLFSIIAHSSYIARNVDFQKANLYLSWVYPLMVFNLVVQDDPVGFVRGQPGQAERVGAGSHQVDGGHGRRRCGQTTEEGKAEASKF